ncbi:MAG TPA: VCBS repeat-containing protein [Verrucomicrobiae bacterium]
MSSTGAKSADEKPWRRLLLLLAGLVLVSGVWFFRNQPGGGSTTVPTNTLQILTAFETRAAAVHWKPELEAQQRLRTITALWDAINHSTNKLATALNRFSPRELLLPTLGAPVELPHNIRVSQAILTRNDPAPYSRLLELSAGWQLDQCEFRFISINPDTFYTALHLTNPRTQTRAILEGNVLVEFSASNTLQRVDASRLELRTRSGAPAFAEMFHAAVPPPAGSYFIDPLIVWDLNSDGQLEVILAAANVVIRRTPEGTWTPDRFVPQDLGLIFTALLGDFSGNGTTDLLTVKFEGIYLYEGSVDGTFITAPHLVWSAQPRLRYPQAFTAGDVDRDGDLDLFIGQYKVPFENGQMPFPYFNANDGFPSFLLANDGTGNFADITQRAGLAAKRARRAYSASLVDLDSDSDLDLLLVSDFAGLDFFENNGERENLRFTDATTKRFDQTAALGMAHSFADFNRDGLLDIIMIGMNSPLADRLESARLTRPYDAPDHGKRAALTHGNRLYFGTTDGRFVQTDLSQQVARTGWSWGSAAGDLDNDGYPELYVVNGHASRASTEDYEKEFWLHDIYVGTSQENSLADAYFRQKLTAGRQANHTYGGHERNRLFLNQSGTNFVEAAHLYGVALPQDCRNTASIDLDNDGRLDLVVTTFEEFPEVRQTVRFFRNKLESIGRHATGTLRDIKKTGLGGRLVAKDQAGVVMTNAFTFVSGESYRTQTAPTIQLGIGNAAEAFADKPNDFLIQLR